MSCLYQNVNLAELSVMRNAGKFDFLQKFWYNIIIRGEG